MSPRITTTHVQAQKGQKPLCVLTAYDVSFARVIDRAGIDIILVGDSAGQAILGYESTIPVTMDQMVMLASAVSRGVEHALVVADMPFLSYQASVEDALRNAGRLLKEAGVQGVKLEGGARSAATAAALVAAGIPVMGHLGMTPQSVHQFGGPRVQARTHLEAEALIADAQALEAAGVFAIVLEVIPWQVAEAVTRAVSIPTIGIGAGPCCDGQVLVMHDLLGLGDHLSARFCPAYANLNNIVTEAVQRWQEDVTTRRFPQLDQSYTMPSNEAEQLSAAD